MIPQAAITRWALDHPWSTPEQVEQDLILSRAICVIAADPYLGAELTFRGGTALHKLHFSQAYRYSEDLDYVRSTAGGVGRVLDTLRDLGRDLGFAVRSQLGEHPRVLWRAEAEHGIPLRVKVEINTHERAPAMPIMSKPFAVESTWWSGSAQVRTFQLPELIATKLRALYQRSKGRDLYDIWLALTEAGADPDAVLSAFGPYRPAGYTAHAAVVNLEAKLDDQDFRHDLDALTVGSPADYDLEAAASLVIRALLARV
jgi:predicted nucleotidyltransferase component of viral defense system